MGLLVSVAHLLVHQALVATAPLVHLGSTDRHLPAPLDQDQAVWLLASPLSPQDASGATMLQVAATLAMTTVVVAVVVVVTVGAVLAVLPDLLVVDSAVAKEATAGSRAVVVAPAALVKVASRAAVTARAGSKVAKAATASRVASTVKAEGVVAREALVVKAVSTARTTRVDSTGTPAKEVKVATTTTVATSRATAAMASREVATAGKEAAKAEDTAGVDRCGVISSSFIATCSISLNVPKGSLCMDCTFNNVYSRLINMEWVVL